MNTSSYSYQPQKKKKKKDSRIEVDGKPMSKYQRKLMEKDAKREERVSEEKQGESLSSTEYGKAFGREFVEPEIPSLELSKDFKGQFPKEILEEAEELFRESFQEDSKKESNRNHEEKNDSSENKQIENSKEENSSEEGSKAENSQKKAKKFSSGEGFLKPEAGLGEPLRRTGGRENVEGNNRAGGKKREPSRIRPDYRNEACLESFPCSYCGKEIRPEGAGSEHRNHCPHCLHSLHVDVEPGDRASNCHGDMEPIAIWVKDRGEWALVHRCKSCGKLNTNRVLADDNPVELMSLAVKALANPPFPLRMLSDYLDRKI